MSRSLLPTISIIDNALSSELASAILEYATSHRDDFSPATIHRTGNAGDLEFRSSMRCKAGLGPFEHAFAATMERMFPDLCVSTGTAPFTFSELETELVAHRDGDFYKEHIDIRRAEDGRPEASPRVLTTVWYLNLVPKKFEGGHIRLRAIVGDETKTIEPIHNRLIAFPAFAPHEVLPTSVPGNAFENARFAVNCWFRRKLG